MLIAITLILTVISSFNGHELERSCPGCDLQYEEWERGWCLGIMVSAGSEDVRVWNHAVVTNGTACNGISVYRDYRVNIGKT